MENGVAKYTKIVTNLRGKAVQTSEDNVLGPNIVKELNEHYCYLLHEVLND